jgi:hypothetical protein
MTLADRLLLFLMAAAGCFLLTRSAVSLARLSADERAFISENLKFYKPGSEATGSVSFNGWTCTAQH